MPDTEVAFAVGTEAGCLEIALPYVSTHSVEVDLKDAGNLLKRIEFGNFRLVRASDFCNAIDRETDDVPIKVVPDHHPVINVQRVIIASLVFMILSL